MVVAHGRLGLAPSHPIRTGFMRGVTFAIAAYGLSSLAAVNVGAKLTIAVTMDFCDFESQALAFFANLGAIIGLV